MAKLEDQFYKTLDQAKQNKTYAKKLKNLATKAALAGVGSDEWEALTKEFSTDPTELAQMRNPDSRIGGSGIDIRITTLTTGPHGINTVFTSFLTTLGLIPARKKESDTSAPKKRATKRSAGKARSTKK